MKNHPNSESNSAPAPKAAETRKMLFERLEDRVLFDAVPDAPVETDAEQDQSLDQANAEKFDTSLYPEDVKTVSDASLVQQQDDSNFPEIRRELVIVDTSVEDYQLLVDDLLGEDDPSREFEVVTIDATKDGIEEISAILAGQSNLDALHIVSHGDDSGVNLGNVFLTRGNLGGYAAEIAQWGNALSENGDLLFLGCELASTADGRELLTSIATLTGADVAASTDDTGYAPRGGDWDLEYILGEMETTVAFSDSVQSSWRGLLAPGPTVALNVPTEAYIGDAVNFTATFNNIGSAPADTGYGPFIDLIFPVNGADGASGTDTSDGLSFLGASYLGSDLTTIELVFPDDDGAGLGTTGTIDHPYAVDSSGTPLQVTGTAGDKLVVIQLPFGSFVPGQPAPVIDIEAQLSNLADPYDAGSPETELDIRARAGFQYGNDELNNPATDPSVVSDIQTDSSNWAVSAEVQPTLLDMDKTYSGPEDETATGPNFIRSYTIRTFLAAGQTLNDLTITDFLPNTYQYVPGSLVVTNGAATLTASDYTIIDEPVSPGAQNPSNNDLVVRIDQAVIGAGPGAAAATITFDFFVPLNDADGNSVNDPTNGDDTTAHNDASITGQWLPTDVRDQPAITVSSNATTQDHTLEQQSIAIQKGVAIGDDTGSAGVTPGDELEYTINFQVSDFFAFDDVIITDTFSDGQDWYSDSPTDSSEVMIPTLQFTEHGTTVAIGDFSASNYTVTENVDGTTTVVFDVSQELIDRATAAGATTPSEAGELLGGWIAQGGTGIGQPDGSFNGGATTGQIVFRTEVLEDYKDPGMADQSVDQGDELTNTIAIDGRLLNVDNLSARSTREADDSGASVTIETGNLEKSIYAINGDTNWGPFFDPDGDGNPNVVSGDLITYRIEYTLPTSDVEGFELVDFLPLPVFDSTGLNGTRIATSDTPPGENEWRLHTSDTFTDFYEANATPADSFGGASTVEIAAESATNSFRVQYGTVDDPNSVGRKVDLLITVPITAKPAADGLFYTNQAQTIENNTFGGQTVNQVISQQDVQVFTPVVNIRKGIVDSSDTTAFSSTDGGNTVTFNETSGAVGFSGNINSDWLGSTTFDSLINSLDAGDTARFAVVVENTGMSRTGAYDVTVSDLLPTGLLNYVSGSLQVFDGTGAALSYTQADGSAATDADLFTTGLRLVDPGATAAGAQRTDEGALDQYDETDGRNVAVFIYDVTIDPSAQPDSQLDNSASLDGFASNEGGQNYVTTPETAEAGVTVRNVSATKSIVATSEAHTGNAGGTERVAIGEIIRYRIELEIPEGTIPHLTLRDKLPGGLTFIDDGTATVAFVSDSGSVSSSTLSGGTLNIAGDDGTVSGFTPTFVLPDSAISENNDPGVEDDTWASGSDPYFKLGDVVNNDTDADNEYVVIEFNALVDNSNGSGQNDTNDARHNDLEVLFDSNGNGTIEDSEEAYDLPNGDRPLVRIVEPLINNFDKSADFATGDAGDVVTYTVTFDVASGDTRSDAFDVRLRDVLPAGELTFVGGSLAVQVGVSTLTAGVDFTDSTAGNSIDFSVHQIAKGESVTITYQATIDVDVNPTDVITNRANVSWTSLPGDSGTANGSGGNATGSDLASLDDTDTGGSASSEYNTKSGETQGERDGSGQNDPANSGDDTQPNDYHETSTASVTIDGTSLSKTLDGTSIDDSAGASNNVGDEAVIGEIVTYTITLDFNEATLPNATLTDTLDSGLVFVGVTGFTVNDVTLDPSVDLTDPSVSADGRTITWNLDTIADSTPEDDGTAGDSDGQITITYQTIVTNVSTNQAATELNNTVNFQWDDDAGTAPNPRESLTAFAANVTVIEPELTVTKAVALDTDGDSAYDDGKLGDAGDGVQYTITLTNASGVDAFDIDFTDVLPTVGGGTSAILGATLASVNDSATSSAVSASDFEIVGSDATGYTLQRIGSSNIDILASQVDGSGNPRVITLVVQGTIASSVSPNEDVDNTAFAQWTSIDGAVANPSTHTTDDTERTGADGAGGGNLNNYEAFDADTFTINAPAFTKHLVSTDQTETSGSDVTIGEVVTYALKVSLPEGVTPDATVVDILPPGLDYESFEIVTDHMDPRITGLLTETFDGTIAGGGPAVTGGASSGDDVTFAFGQIDVTVDNNANNNAFLILVNTRVVDVPTNTGYDGNQQTLTNDATIDFSTDSVAPQSVASAVNVVVVEPSLEITKEFGPTVNTDVADSGDTVTVNLTVSNADGESAAYEVAIEDTLNPLHYNLSSINLGTAGVNYPAGFAVSFDSGTGLLQYSGGDIAAGASVTFSVTIDLLETVTPNQTLTNTATITDGSTLEGTVAGERNSPDADGDGSDVDTDTVRIRRNSLAGFVWDDTNNDGIKQVGESGINGVEVRLVGTDHHGNSVNTTVTTSGSGANAGAYLFDNLRPGTYSIQQDPDGDTIPAGYLDGQDTIGTPGGIDTVNDFFLNVNLPTGTETFGNDNNFGEIQDADLSGAVYHDADNDGAFDGSETGINGVQIQLTGKNDLGQDVTLNVITAGGGLYSFTGLRPSDANGYTITQVNEPVGYLDGQDTDGSLANGDDSSVNNAVSSINVAPGASGTSYDFGEVVASTLSGYVYHDSDNDGLRSDEAIGHGIQNSRIMLTGTDDLGNPVSEFVDTDANGYYEFTGLRPSNGSGYTLTQTSVPAGYIDGKDTIGTPGGVDTTNNVFSGISVTSGTTGVENSFAELLPASLSGTVFNDHDNDGSFEPGDGETGIEGVSVRIQGTDDLGNAVDVTLQTDSDGNYSFTNLRPSNPAGYSLTETHPTAYTDGTDSDGSLANGIAGNDTITSINVSSGNAGSDYDFGEQGTTISGTVFVDDNRDGDLDGGEATRLGGITVELFDMSDPLLPVSLGTATTGVDGTYSFDNLPAGDYRVVQSQPTQYGNTSNNTINLTLPLGGSTGNDFGEALYDIGDTIYFDADNNGTQNGAEQGIADVQVTLQHAGADGIFGNGDDPASQTTTTDASGAYSFTELFVGNYRVSVTSGDLPDGVTGTEETDDVAFGAASVNGTSNIAITNADRFDADFGYTGSSTIGNFVWMDMDGDGVQDGNEPGLDDVTVNLRFAGEDGIFGNDDDLTLSTETDSSGEYSFSNLPAGDFQIAVDSADTDLPGSITPVSGSESTSGTASLTLATGGTNNDVDFGFTGTLEVGDRLWLDQDGDQVQDAGEPGLPDVGVTLVWFGQDGTLGTADDVSLSDTTDANGEYGFVTLPDGNYRISYSAGDLPSAVSPTYEVDGTTNNQVDFSLAGSSRDDVDFGFNGAGNIGDFVWLDADGDGLQEAGEPGLANVDVILTFAGADGNFATTADNVSITTTTNASGGYNFAGLPDGDYRVAVDTADTDLPGSIVAVSGAESVSGTADVTLDATQRTYTNIDFGFAGTRTVGDFVWMDTNGDGNQDVGEPGLGLVDVSLLFAGQDGTFGTADDVTKSTTTAADGSYGFTSLPDGDYRVSVDTNDLPVAVTPTDDVDGTLDNRGDFTITGANRTDVDFGYEGARSLGDRFWYDADADGVQDAGEPGIVGVDVILTFAGKDNTFGNADDFVLTAVTGAGGQYSFVGLPEGDYRVTFDASDLPSGMNVGTSEEDDAAPTIDGTANVGLGATDRSDVDFGFAGARTLGDFVFFDADNDGSIDAGEPGFGDVDVTLLFEGQDGIFGTADDVTRTTTTAADGSYSFANLPDGDFRVSIDTSDLPAGTTQTYEGDGTTGNQLDVAVSGSNIDTADFGFAGSGSISDFVWLDADGDGVQDGGEPGLTDVTVNLTSAGEDGVFGNSDDFTLSTETNSSGGYSFDNLPAGDYRIDVDTADTDLPGSLTGVAGAQSTDGTASVTLAVGETRDDVDFGFTGTLDVGDRIWFDADGDGVQDLTNEPGLVGVDVTLVYAGQDGTYGTADDITKNTTTGADGAYAFGNLSDGDYRISVDTADLPTGAVQTFDVDQAPFTVSLDDTARITLAGVDRDEIDFGYQGSLSMGDTFFHDMNADGSQAVGEPGIAGVDVTATFAGADNIFGTADDFALTTTTNSTGNYLFDNLFEGDYRVSFDSSDLPSGMDVPTVETDDSGAALDGTANVSLNADRDDIDFGFAGARTVGDRLWFDADGDGVQDASNEPGFVGVDVTIIFAGPNGTFGDADDASLTTTTGADGAYSFANLPNGDHRISYDLSDLPTGITQTYEQDASINNQSDFTIAGSDRDDIDFGFNDAGSISNQLWYDVNGDGTFSQYDTDGDSVADTNEPGLAGVTVTAVFGGSDGLLSTTADNFTLTTVTAADGTYAFNNLPAGEYTVTVDSSDLPASFVSTHDKDDFGTVADDGVSTVNLADDETDEDVDFGFRGTNSVGDVIWFDRDGDGVQDSLNTATGEPGLGGVGVTLTFAGADGNFATTADNVTLATVTAADGSYGFDNLFDGNYRVAVDASTLPTAMTQTYETDGVAAGDNNNLADFSVSGGDRTDIDFGYEGALSVGDRVWYDADADGNQDAGEPGISGVDVLLTFAGADGNFATTLDNFVVQTTTSAAGAYSFDNLPEGDYRIAVVSGTLPLDMTNRTAETDDSSVAIDGTSNISLTADRDNVDFGFAGNRTVGDFVWFDQDGNGVRNQYDTDGDGSVDTLEPGYGNVEVTMLFAGQNGTFGDLDDVTLTTTTAADGSYSFANIPNGDFRLSVDTGDIPAGTSQTFDQDDATFGAASLDDTGRIRINGADRSDVDFGYNGGGTISDFVWLDVDADGIQDGGEPGLAGISVDLVFYGDDGIKGTADDFSLSTFTNSTGGYSFTNLPAGQYEVAVNTADTDLPTGLTPVSGTQSISGIANVNLGVNETRDNIDFGFAGTRELGDTVFFDFDNNGVQNQYDTDGDSVADTLEPGIGDVGITLLSAGQDGTFGTIDDFTVTTSTDSDGNYSIENLPDLDYRVSVTAGDLPTGSTQTADQDDAAFGAGSLDHTSRVRINGADRTDADFGYRGPRTLGDRLWHDANADGLQTAGEPGVADITITAVFAGEDGIFGNADDFTLTTITDALGAYQFANLPEGDYRISYDASDLPSGMTTNTFDVDSTIDGTANVTVGATDRSDVDFGFAGTLSVGDRLWFDFDGDGIQDATNEPGLVGVDVTLLFAGPDGTYGTVDDATLSTTTGADGAYLFENLPDGNYRVSYDASDLPGAATNALTQTFEVDASINNEANVALSGSSVDTVDFGFRGDGLISDYLWIDVDGDGLQEAGEPALHDIDVIATFAGADGTFGNADDFTLTVATDANGLYSFDNLPDGNYRVAVDTTDTDLPGSMNPVNGTQSNSGTVNVTLNGTQRIFTDVDFGFVGTNSVGNFVWFDSDGDGVQDVTNEPGLGLVDLTLTFAGQDGIFGNADDFTLDTTTDANGAYSFGQLPDGAYRVAIDTADLPTGMTQTFEQNDGTNTLAHTAEFVVNAADRTDIDFGYEGALNLGDTVWYDVDGNATKDAGEPGLNNIDVNLLFAGANGTFGDADDFVLATTTIASGAYNFANLPEGEYRVAVDTADLPSGMNVITAETDDSAAANDGTSNISLTSDRTDVDFGFRGNRSLGDRLWFDGNGDGVQDVANEPGLGDVRVNLLFAGQDGTFGTADDVTIQDTTDTNGNYEFSDLPNGDFRISVETSDLPAGMNQTFEVDGVAAGDNNNRADININGSDTDIVDFGFRGTGSISDRVWHDTDGDGVQDGTNEPGLVGVTVNLAFAGEDGVFGTTDDFSLTTTTGADGLYSFDTLPAGDYRVDVVEADIPGSRTQTFERNDSTNAIAGVAEVSLSVGQTRDDVDFGYAGTLTLGDRVWFDANNDGLQSAGEPGLNGIGITLLYAGPDGNFATTADNVTLNTTTDSTGNYSFEKLLDGDYRVEVVTADLPGGAIQTADQDDAAFGGAALDHTANVSLSAANRDDADFGYRGNSTIGDLIFFDADNSGTLNAGDRGLPGIDVTAEVDINGDNVVDYTVTVTTDINGAYVFENLIPGSYTVTVDDTDLPQGMAANPTVDPNGTATPHTTTVNLGTNETNDTTDFGYNSVSTIGDFIWLDTNGDGVQDGTNEPGLANVDVTLTWYGADGVLDAGPGGDDEVFTTTTDANGAYVFEFLAGGNYQIDVDETTAPGNTSLTTGNDGIVIALPPGTSNDTIDFGFVGGATGGGTIGDRVFFDHNGNGVEDGDDVGYAGIVVTVEGDVDGDGVNEVFTATTDVNGDYSLPGLPEGDYSVTLTPPNGTSSSFDADGTGTPNTSNVSLTTASPSSDIQDFGLTGTGTVGDTVFFDEDGNGIQDGTEVGIPGVTVQIDVDLDGDGNPDFTTTAVTDQDGKYSFTNIPEGEVTVTVATPSGSNPTTNHDGTVGGDDTNTLNLPAGDTDNTSDFGYLGTGSIGNTVFFDGDSDGIQDDGLGTDPSEPGLPGVQVFLDIDFNGDGTVDHTIETTTGADGTYSFTNLPAGDYTVRVTQPAGTTPTFDNDGITGLSSNQSSHTLTAGEDNTDQDFGYTGTGTITDTVFFDIDNDATEEVGGDDRGLPNVEVILNVDINGDGNPDYTTTVPTDSNGDFTFTNLIPGTYTITTDPADMPPGLAANPTVDNDGTGTAHEAGYTVTPGNTTDGPGFGFHATPDYDIVKTGNGNFTSAKPGDTVSYTILVKNVGELDGRNVTITDNFPTSVLSITNASGGTIDAVNGVIEWDIAALAPNEQQVITVTATVINPIAAGINDFTNSVTVDDDHYNGDDPDTTNNSSSYTATLDAAPDYGITKMNGVGVDTLQPGESTTYTITVTNTGDQDGTAVVVTDRFPVGILSVTNSDGGTVDAIAGTITWNLGDLNVGDTVILQPMFDVVTPALAAQHDFVNTADIADDGTNGVDPNPGNNSATDSDILNAVPDYRITKTLNGSPAFVEPNDFVTYSILVENIGNQNGTGVVVTDSYPTDALTNVTAPGATVDSVTGTIIWNVGDLDGNGDSVILTVTGQVRSTLAATIDDLVNEASVTDDLTNGTDPTPANNSDDDVTPIGARPDLTITKTDGGAKDVRPGETVIYTIEFGNVGPQEATNVVITEFVPEGSTFNADESSVGWVDQGNGSVTFDVASLPSGDTGAIEFAVTVNETLDPNRETLENSVSIADDGTNGADLNTDNNVATDTTPLQVYTFDSFRDFSGNENDLATYNAANGEPQGADPYKNRLKPLPIDTVFTGIVDPGTTLSGKIYDEYGRMIGEQIVVADSAGNWLMQFPTVVLYEAPHEMRIDQTLAVQNDTFDAGFNLRRFFHPAIHTQLYMNEPISLGAAFYHSPMNVLEAMHAANNDPLGFGWMHHAYELIVSSTNTSAM